MALAQARLPAGRSASAAAIRIAAAGSQPGASNCGTSTAAPGHKRHYRVRRSPVHLGRAGQLNRGRKARRASRRPVRDGYLRGYGCGRGGHCGRGPPGRWPTVQENFATVLETVADVRADRIAVTHGDRSLTWRELDERASRLAGFLAGRGIGPEARVAIALYNGPEYLESVFAVLKLRAIPV